MKLTELVECYISENDICSLYEDHLRRAVRYLHDYVGRPLEHFPLNSINSFLDATVQRTSRNNAINYRRQIITLWNYAAELGECEYPNTRRIRRIKPDYPPPTAPTKPQIRQLVDAAGELKGEYEGVGSRSHYWQAIIVGAFDLGFRKGDMLSLPRDIVDGEPFSWKESKTGQVQCRQLSPLGCSLLGGLNHPTTAYHWPRGLTTWRNTWNTIRQTSGVDFPFKSLRRSHGTYAGTLGHRDSKVFHRHYLDQTINTKPSTPGEL